MSTHSKKIALILPTLHAGGMERVMTELANYFSTKKNVEVHLILFNTSATLFYPLDKKVVLHLNKRDPSSFVLLQALQTIRFIRKKIQSLRPDTILSFGTQWNNLVLFSLLGVNIPVFISDRGSPIRKYRFSTETLKSVLYPKAKGFIAQTTQAAEVAQQRFPKLNIKVIGNPIRMIEDRKDIVKDYTVLSVGRLIDSKHHDRLIAMFSKLDMEDWNLIIVGGDAIKQKNSIRLQQQIDETDVRKRVVLAGTQENVEEFYLKSKIFAFTSSVEGFPNVIGEAMSAGLPVVAYDCVAGPSDIIEDGKNGYLIPLFDDKIFEEKLRFLMKNEKVREQMGAYARESIKKFSVENIGEEFYKFILSEDKIPTP